MKIRIAKAPLRSLTRAVQWTLGSAATATLAYCGLALADGWHFQQRERLHFDEMLLERPVITVALPAAAIAKRGDLIGRLDVPRLNLSVMVAEGVDNRTLRRAAGHIPGTAFPGEAGNTGLSAHRDTFFRPLRNIRRDDIITVTTLAGTFRYRVVTTRIVSPADTSVLDGDSVETLTLVTCYPFYFVGSAPDRFIVRAERIG
jgi:sortase A